MIEEQDNFKKYDSKEAFSILDKVRQGITYDFRNKIFSNQKKRLASGFEVDTTLDISVSIK